MNEFAKSGFSKTERVQIELLESILEQLKEMNEHLVKILSTQAKPG